MKIAAIILLSSSLLGLYLVDYSTFFPRPQNERQLAMPKALGHVDQHLNKYHYTRYNNTITDGIFFEPEIIPPPPPPKPVPKPVPVKQVEPPKPVQRLTLPLEIKGIVITPINRLAMVWDKQTQESHVLREKEWLRNWQLVSIRKQKVVLRHESGATREFILNEEAITNFNFQG